MSVDFKEPVSEFSATMALSNATLLEYYTQLNDFERRQYLQTLAIDRSVRVGEVNEVGNRTGLVAQFSPASIKARLEALNLLEAYAARLSALAGADAPQRFNSGAQTLGSNLVNLDATFRELSNPGATDPSASKYVEPVATIVGVIGEMYLDKKRDEAIKEAVVRASPAVNAILDTLDQDIKLMIDPLRRMGAEQALTGAMVDYNRRRYCKDEMGRALKDCEIMSDADRRAALEEISEFAAGYEIAITNEPVDVVDGIRDAHAALVTYATSEHKPSDLAAFVAALELFNKRVRPIAESLAKARSNAQ